MFVSTWQIKHIVYIGQGNATPAAEFNFCHDPEAALITITHLACPLKVLSRETCSTTIMPWVCTDHQDMLLRELRQSNIFTLNYIYAHCQEFVH